MNTSTNLSRFDAMRIQLHHVQIVEKSQVVIRLGKILLASGAGAYRVKSAMARAAKAVGLDRHESQVSLMEITATAWQGDNFRTETVEVRVIGVNAEKLDRLMVLCSRLHKQMTVAELNMALDQVERQTWVYPAYFSALASGIGCAGFSFLNNGRLLEFLLVFVVAGLGQYLRRFLFKRHVTHFAVWICCALFSTTLYIAILESMRVCGFVYGGHRVGLISGILYLIPGFPMVTAVLDFARMDFWSAITRINYCVMVLVSAAVSVVCVTYLTNWDLMEPTPVPLAAWIHYGIWFICSFISVASFAVLFNASWKVALAAAVMGGTLNTGRLFLMNIGVPWQMAVGLAALLVGVGATFIAWFADHSRVSLSVPAVVIMIPGVPFYKALVFINAGKFELAMIPLLEVFLVVMAIGLGLALARLLTDPGWLFETDTNRLKVDLETQSRRSTV